MKAAHLSETSVPIYETTGHHIAEDRNFLTVQRRELLISDLPFNFVVVVFVVVVIIIIIIIIVVVAVLIYFWSR